MNALRAIACYLVSTSAFAAGLEIGDLVSFKEDYQPIGRSGHFSTGQIAKVVKIVPPSWVEIVPLSRQFGFLEQDKAQVRATALRSATPEETAEVGKQTARVLSERRTMIAALAAAGYPISEESARALPPKQLLEAYIRFLGTPQKLRTNAPASPANAASVFQGGGTIWPDGRVIGNDGSLRATIWQDGRIIGTNGDFRGTVWNDGRIIGSDGNYQGVLWPDGRVIDASGKCIGVVPR